MTDAPEAPDGWHWGLGESGGSYYDHWLYTDAALYQDEDSRGSKFGCEIHLYHDRGGDHIVELIPITAMLRNGDYRYGYEEAVGRFDTEKEATEAAVEKAREIR